MSLPTFLAFRNLVLNFLNFLNSRALLSYKPLCYLKKTCICDMKDMRGYDICDTIDMRGYDIIEMKNYNKQKISSSVLTEINITEIHHQ